MFKLPFKYCVWATCKAKTSFSEQSFHSEVLLGDAPLKCNGQNSIPVSMRVNPLPFSTHHSSISLCFHCLHHATSNSPAFKSTLLSSWWSLQFIHWQTLHLSLVQRCRERSPRRVIPASGTFVPLLVTVVSFPVFLKCVGAYSGQERETTQYLNRLWVSPVFYAWHFQADGEAYCCLLWKWCGAGACLQRRGTLGCPPAMYFSVTFSDLQCPCSSQDPLYAMKIA